MIKAPKGRVKALRVEHEQGREPNAVAVWAKVICEDEDGNLWSFRASCFNFDMTLEQESEEGKLATTPSAPAAEQATP